MILEEVNQPYPRCPKCDMFVFHKALNGPHLATAFFCRGEENNWQRLAEEEAQAGTEMAMTAYGIPLALVASFKYLGRFLSKTDGDWPEVVHNLWCSQHNWESLSRVLSR